MHIYLKHPIHGTKVAISHAEAEYDEQSGWMAYNPATPSDDLEEVVPANTLGLRRKYTRKVTDAAQIEGV